VGNRPWPPHSKQIRSSQNILLSLGIIREHRDPVCALFPASPSVSVPISRAVLRVPAICAFPAWPVMDFAGNPLTARCAENFFGSHDSSVALKQLAFGANPLQRASRGGSKVPPGLGYTPDHPFITGFEVRIISRLLLVPVQIYTGQVIQRCLPTLLLTPINMLYSPPGHSFNLSTVIFLP
jgi:hypothetical protein